MGTKITSELTKLLLDNSTKRFYVEYNDFFYNHMSQGIIALSRLGAGTERIQRFIDWASPSLKNAADHKPQDFDNEIKRIEENAAQGELQKLSINDEASPSLSSASTGVVRPELLGKRQSYYILLEEYYKLLKVQCGGSVEQLICHYFPSLIPGIMGGAFHGMIQIGYGLVANNSWLVCEGLAYQHQSYLPLNLKQNSVKSAFLSIGKGNTDIVEVLQNISRDAELRDFIAAERETEEYKVKPRGEFTFRVNALFSKRPDVIVKYASQIKFPDFYNAQSLTVSQMDQLTAWIRDSAIAVYALAKSRNDFFLLHGVTSSWALSQVVSILTNAGGQQGCEEALKLLRTFLCALIATYVAQNTPEIGTDVDVLLQRKKGCTAWHELLEDALAGDMDEHVYKLIQVCYEESQSPEKAGDPVKDKLYRAAAISALDFPFTFTLTEE